MKRRTLLLLSMMIAYFGMATSLLAQTDVTDTYLMNASFDDSPNYDAAATGDLAPANDGSANLDVTSWTKAVNEYSTSATFAYGTAATMDGIAVPATDADGMSAGAALGIAASWSANIRYSQYVTLPAGTYTLSYKGFNTNAGGSVGNSLAGWVPDAGDAVLSTISGGFTYNTWVTDQITFAVTHETSGKIQLGMLAGAHSGLTDKAHMFFDHVQLMYDPVVTSDATISDITLDAGTIAPGFDWATTNYIVTIPTGVTTINVTPTLNDVSASFTGGGAVDVSGGETVETITVTAQDGVTTKDYTITFAPDCYTPLFTDRNNLVADPLCNNRGSFGGWGTVATTVDPLEVYCGTSSMKIGDGTDTGCEAAFDINSFNYKANTTYRVRAMLKTVGGSIGFLANGADPNYNDAFDTGDAWEQIDFLFTTGANPSASFITFNKCDNGSDCNTAFLDNYEIYEVDNDVNLSSLSTSLGALNPSFDAGVTSYELIVDPATTAVTLTGVANSATSVVSGDGEITLTDGSATAEVTVTAESGNVQTYTVNISSVSSDATLSDLSLSAGILSPVFDGSITSYKAYVSSGSTSVDITATPNFGAASVTSGDGTVSFSIGDTKDVVVTAEDGTTETYSITFIENGTLVNAGFNESCNYLFDAAADNLGTSTDGTTILSVPGWTPDFSGWSAGASFEYTSAVTLNGNAFPTADIDGFSGTGQGGLGVCAAWTGSVYYSQEMALEPGTYKLTYDVNNFGSDVAGTSLAGWVPDGGSAVMSTLSDIATGAWTNDAITFTVSETTVGTIQVGIQAANAGSGANGRFVFDNVQVSLDTSTDVDRSEESTLVKVYPTVSTGNFTVEFADEVGAITVYNMAGSVVKQIANPSSVEVISIEKSGMYIIKAESGSKVKLVKVIKK